MIVYKIDKQSQASASSQIKDMAVVLNEIAPTLGILQKLLAEHRQSISTPSIDQYCVNLQQAVDGAKKLSKIIADNSQQLCKASDQAAKHLAAVDEHFGAVLREEPNSSAKSPVQV